MLNKSEVGHACALYVCAIFDSEAQDEGLQCLWRQKGLNSKIKVTPVVIDLLIEICLGKDETHVVRKSTVANSNDVERERRRVTRLF